jgi:heme-degrading monooxygenase HmoA
MSAPAGGAHHRNRDLRRITIMIRLFVRHNVHDYAAWRKGYDAFDPVRTTLGVRGQAVYRSVDDGNDVTVWHDFDSLDAAKAFASSNELKTAMKEAGVAEPPTIWFTKPA